VDPVVSPKVPEREARPLPAALERCNDVHPAVREQLAKPRGTGRGSQHLPISYVDAIPVRVDGRVTLTAIGLLLRVTGQRTITRALVSARVMYQERGRSAVRRHLEKDLGHRAV
jgi:hypothetical protein